MYACSLDIHSNNAILHNKAYWKYMKKQRLGLPTHFDIFMVSYSRYPSLTVY